tara:strand:+ start:804 stop:995 length:192 start_codon:yes stop_codon:yes gene_type:complete
MTSPIAVTLEANYERSINLSNSVLNLSRLAKDDGSDYLVIGRPVTESTNPIKSLEEILKDIEI